MAILLCWGFKKKFYYLVVLKSIIHFNKEIKKMWLQRCTLGQWYYKVHAPSCREPSGLLTIVPRTERFAYHCAENRTVCVPLCQTLRFAICCIGIDTSVGTQRAMPGAQSTLTKRVGAEPNQQNKHKHSNTVPEPKDGNVHMTQTPPSVGNHGLITQDWKVHKPVVREGELHHLLVQSHRTMDIPGSPTPCPT